MAEYIERKKLEEAFDNADPDVCESNLDGYSAWGFGRENVRDVIRGVPTADVAPIKHGQLMAEYIDRETLLHDVEQSVVYTVREKITSAEMRGARKVIERIKCAPAVEPIYIHEPTKSEFKRMAAQMDYVPVVHGQWILRHIGAGHYWECSVCHTNPCIYVTEHTKFCPNCGARMDEGED